MNIESCFCYNHAKRRHSRGFTMVEIAISIAVVAFALVAIMGVLPTGMTVQKDNREDTIVNQEGRYWLEAIRTGGRGMDHLTNYVEAITFTQAGPNGEKTISVPLEPLYRTDATRTNSILTYLLRPRIENSLDGRLTNRVTARVKPLTGMAVEQGPLTNDVTFRYELQVDLVPDESLTHAGVWKNDPGLALAGSYLEKSAYDIRLLIRYPLYQRGTNWIAGSGRRAFRTKIAGTLVPVVPDPPFSTNDLFYYIEPNRFAAAIPNANP